MSNEAPDWNKLSTDLEATGDFKVLRRLKPRRVLHPYDGSEVRRGLFVDVETTGLNHQVDDVVQLALVPFRFSRDGTVFDLDKPYDGRQAPKAPMSEGAATINGISLEDLEGRTLDLSIIEKLIEDADLVVSHNAAFDRPFAEKVTHTFATRPWGCSMTDVSWIGAGFESTKLSYLAMKSGFFYPEHDALFDCFAALELLATPLPNGKKPMRQIMAASAAMKVRIHAEGAPFKARAVLKFRGYHWVAPPERAIGSWWTDVAEVDVSDEIDFLSAEVFHRPTTPTMTRITGLERFSLRAH
jgi:DNA polymerase III subunit epsilon